MTGQFDQLVARLADPGLSNRLTPERRPHGQAHAAVLILLSEINDPDLLFTERAVGLRKHAGQISFPGGTYEPGDADAPATALRETWEEVGLQPDKVTLLEVPALTISSTACRERVAQGLPIWYLVPDGIVQYIAKRGLYRPRGVR